MGQMQSKNQMQVLGKCSKNLEQVPSMYQVMGQVQSKYQVVGKYSTWGRCSQSTRWWESTVPGADAVKVPGGGKVQYLGQVQSKYQVEGKYTTWGRCSQSTRW